MLIFIAFIDLIDSDDLSSYDIANDKTSLLFRIHTVGMLNICPLSFQLFASYSLCSSGFKSFRFDL